MQIEGYAIATLACRPFSPKGSLPGFVRSLTVQANRGSPAESSEIPHLVHSPEGRVLALVDFCMAMRCDESRTLTGPSVARDGERRKCLSLGRVLYCTHSDRGRTAAKERVLLDILSPVHLIIILAIALLLFGPKRLPELGQGLGKTIREFRKAMQEGSDAADKAASPPSKEEELR